MEIMSRARFGGLILRILFFSLQILYIYILLYKLDQGFISTDSALAYSVIQVAISVIIITTNFSKKSHFLIIYTTYLIFSHFGAVFFYVLAPDKITIDTAPSQFVWLSSYALPDAIMLSSIGVAALTLGAHAKMFKQTAERYQRIAPMTSSQSREDSGLYDISIAILTLCMLYMIIMVLLGRLPILQGYSQYRDAMAILPGYPIFLLLLSVSTTFSIAVAGRSKLFIPLIIFSIPASLLFLSGNRGEVLFPVAGILAALLARGYRIRLPLILAGILVFFVAIPVLQKTRSSGLSSISSDVLISGAADPFVEIGFTLRPFVDTVEWIYGGEEYSYGGSYMLPFLNQIRKISPLAFQTSFDIQKNDLQAREEGKGYSVISEAYFNYSTPGVITIMFLTGFLLQGFSIYTKNHNIALAAAILTIMVNNLRNVFIFVPAHLTITILLYFLGTNYLKLKRPGVRK